MDTLFFLHTSYFSDIFGVPEPVLKSDESSRVAFNSDLFLLECFFTNLGGSSNGGALSCTSSSVLLYIGFTSFKSCAVSYYKGGAIYFTNGAGAALKGICGTLCNADQAGLLIYQTLSSSSTKPHHINLTTAASCPGDFVSEGSAPIHMQHGQIYIESVNTSKNTLLYQGGLRLDNGGPLTAAYYQCANTTTRGPTIERKDDNCLFTSCNFLFITNTESQYGLFLFTGGTNFSLVRTLIRGNTDLTSKIFSESSSSKFYLFGCDVQSHSVSVTEYSSKSMTEVIFSLYATGYCSTVYHSPESCETQRGPLTCPGAASLFPPLLFFFFPFHLD